MSQQINLFNPIFRKRGFSFTSADSLLAGFGIVMVFALGYGFYQGHRTGEVARQAEDTARQYADATALRDKLLAQQAGLKTNDALDADIKQLESRLQGRQEIVNTLNSGAIGTTGGFSEYMRAFSRQTISGLWLTGFEIASSSNYMLIEGRTLSADLVPEYLQHLNQETALKGRQFATLNIAQPKIDSSAVQGAPAATNDEPAAVTQGAGGPDKENATAAAPVAPRYLEFSLSTGTLPQAGQRAPALAAATAPSAGAPLPPKTADAIGAAVKAMGGNTEPPQ